MSNSNTVTSTFTASEGYRILLKSVSHILPNWTLDYHTLLLWDDTVFRGFIFSSVSPPFSHHCWWDSTTACICISGNLSVAGGSCYSCNVTAILCNFLFISGKFPGLCVLHHVNIVLAKEIFCEMFNILKLLRICVHFSIFWQKKAL